MKLLKTVWDNDDNKSYAKIFIHKLEPNQLASVWASFMETMASLEVSSFS